MGSQGSDTTWQLNYHHQGLVKTFRHGYRCPCSWGGCPGASGCPQTAGPSAAHLWPVLWAGPGVRPQGAPPSSPDLGHHDLTRASSLEPALGQPPPSVGLGNKGVRARARAFPGHSQGSTMETAAQPVLARGPFGLVLPTPLQPRGSPGRESVRGCSGPPAGQAGPPSCQARVE